MIDFSSVRKSHVNQALSEYRMLGREKFMLLLPSRSWARTWFIHMPGAKENPGLKLIAARAYKLSRPRSKPTRPREFNTRSARIAIGVRLGYPLIGPGASADNDIKKDLEKFDLSKLKESFEAKRQSVRVRQGASSFRNKLLAAYEQCAITGERTHAALDAAHIVPYSGLSSNHVQNGILLRADVHNLFDLNLIRIELNDYRIVIDHSLRRTPYFRYHGKKLRLPADEVKQPALHALSERHRILKNSQQ